jgi:hypothetical protein
MGTDEKQDPERSVGNPAQGVISNYQRGGSLFFCFNL